MTQVTSREQPAAQERGIAFSLAALTVLPCSPLEQIDAAHAAGFDAVGLRLSPVLPTDVNVMADSVLQRTIERRLSRTQLRVLDVEVVRVGPDTNVAALEPALRFAHDLGATSLTFTSPTPCEYSPSYEPKLVSKIAELCEAAARFGIRPALEFMIFRSVARLEDALRIGSLVGHPNFAICIDALHLHRSGGTAESVVGVERRLISCLQLCDAPKQPPADIRFQARFDRLYPGEGGLPLGKLLEALPADVPLSLEAPCRARAEQSPVERAEQILWCARKLLETVKPGVNR